MNTPERRALLDEEILALCCRVVLAAAEQRELCRLLKEKRSQRRALDFVPEKRAAA